MLKKWYAAAGNAGDGSAEDASERGCNYLKIITLESGYRTLGCQPRGSTQLADGVSPEVTH